MSEMKPASKEPSYVREPFQKDLKIGAIVHHYETSRVKSRKSGSYFVPLYACGICPRPHERDLAIGIGLFTSDALDRHLRLHGARDERAYSGAMKRVCGMSDPIPGQIGFADLGVPDVAPVTKRPRPRRDRKAKAPVVVQADPSEKGPLAIDSLDEVQRRLYAQAMGNRMATAQEIEVSKDA